MNFFFGNPFISHRFFFKNSKLIDLLSRQSAVYPCENPERNRGTNPGDRSLLKVRGIYSYLIIILSACACSSAPVKEINTDISKNNINIRYVNIGIIFDYMVNKDPDALDIKKQKESLLKSIDNINKKINSSEDDPNQAILEELKVKQENLLKLKNDEDYYKSRILNEIDSAIESIAGKDDIDFVFNIGEGTVYARKEYDITEKILQEIESRLKRIAPVSR
jgi:Skp family chaperone for outer membrane proteins